MIDFKQIIAESIAQITNIEVNEIKGFIEVPKEQGNGDYAFPCFKLAKTFFKKLMKMKNMENQKLEMVKT